MTCSETRPLAGEFWLFGLVFRWVLAFISPSAPPPLHSRPVSFWYKPTTRPEWPTDRLSLRRAGCVPWGIYAVTIEHAGWGLTQAINGVCVRDDAWLRALVVSTTSTLYLTFSAALIFLVSISRLAHRFQSRVFVFLFFFSWKHDRPSLSPVIVSASLCWSPVSIWRMDAGLTPPWVSCAPDMALLSPV